MYRILNFWLSGLAENLEKFRLDAVKDRGPLLGVPLPIFGRFHFRSLRARVHFCILNILVELLQNVSVTKGVLKMVSKKDSENY